VPRKPTLSPTRITTYLACPVKYRWTYVDDRGKWYLRAKSYYSFGTTLHKVLERFHDSADSGVATVDEALKAYEESWIDAGFASADEMAEAFGEGQDIIERHIEQALQRPSEAKTLFVEKTLSLDMGDFRLLGRIDRVDELPDGTLEIVDYKSGRREVNQEEVEADLALSVYQLLVRRHYPDQPVKATLIALRTGEQASASLSNQDLAQFEADLKKLAEEILNRDYEQLVPVYKPICPRCDFLPLCSRHPDFEVPEPATRPES